MGCISSVGISAIIARGGISDADVLALRRAYYNDGAIDFGEADSLFALNDACHIQVPAWADFFVEALTDYVVNRMPPEGYVTAENAGWLMEKISTDGKVQSATELELLVNVLDKARWSPTSLVSFALDQVKHAVIDGEGPLRAGMTLEQGRITVGEVALLRRVLYAFGGDGNIAITRAEAEVLFEINDACADGPQAAAWTDLFVKAIANVLMATSGYATPAREQALKTEHWLASRGDIHRGFANITPASILAAYRFQSDEEQSIARLESQCVELITNEEITPIEAQWLVERLGRDGKITPNEEALIAWLRKECPKIDPLLDQRLAEMGRAA